MNFYDQQSETLEAAALRCWQTERLCALLDEIETNEFYREKAHAANLTLSSLRSPDRLRALPFTTKTELVEEQAHHPPYGRLLTYPLAEYRYCHQTSGTTGQPLKWLDTQASWQWFTRCWGYVYSAAGVTAEDRVFCAFSFGPYISHWTAISGVWHLGAMALAGGGMNSEQRLQAIFDHQATVIVCTPTYALHLIEVARAKGFDLHDSAVRIGIHAGEPGASLPNVKRAIEDGWGMTCFDHAGATEVGAWAFDCTAQSGAIHLNEAEFIFEVINPASGEAVAEGERGELVITNLGRAAMPVLRYRTGDLVELTREPCACGRSFARIRGGVLGRADDMLIVRGVNLYPSAIDNLLRSIRWVIEYEVQVRRVGGMDDLLLRVEAHPAQPFAQVEQAIYEAFRNQFNVRVSIEPAEEGTLPRYEFKARRFKREEATRD